MLVPPAAFESMKQAGAGVRAELLSTKSGLNPASWYTTEMKEKIDNRAIFDSVLAYSRGYSMGSLWQSLTVELSGRGVDFAEQTEMFLSLLKTQMDHGEIRLALDGAYLEGNTGEQLDVLRRVWPKSRDELESDMGLWFLADAPAGIVWSTPEGQEIWS